MNTQLNMFRLYFILAVYLIMSSAVTIKSQNNSECAFAYLSEANYEFEQHNYKVAFDYLNMAEEFLGETNARILNLKIKILYYIENYYEAKLLIKKFGNFEAGEELKNDTYGYIEKINKKEKQLITEQIDSIYSKGKAAYNNKNWLIAEKYLNKAIDLKYGNGDAVVLLHDVFNYISSISKIEANLVRGFQYYPDNDSIKQLLINYYIQTKQNGYALTYLNKVINSGVEKAKYYYSRGAIYDERKYYKEAVLDYEKSLEINPEYFYALFNIGVLYYNKGVFLINDAKKISDEMRFNSKKTIAYSYFRKALPYFERALKLNPTNESILLSLKSLYWDFKMFEKYNQVNAKLSLL